MAGPPSCPQGSGTPVVSTRRFGLISPYGPLGPGAGPLGKDPFVKPSALVVAAVALPTFSLLGCSGDPEPTIANEATNTNSAPSTAATPSPSIPAPPESADKATAAGAEAFVSFYWDVVTYAQSSGDVSLLKDLALPSCAACSSGLQSIEKTYKAGGKISGGETTVSSATATPFSAGPARGFSVDVEVVTQDQTIDIPGEDLRRNTGGSVSMRFLLQREDREWVVGRWEVTQ